MTFVTVEFNQQFVCGPLDVKERTLERPSETCQHIKFVFLYYYAPLNVTFIHLPHYHILVIKNHLASLLVGSLSMICVHQCMLFVCYVCGKGDIQVTCLKIYASISFK